MYEIKEFCDKVNLEKPNIFKDCKEGGYIREEAKKIEDLNKEELDYYKQKVS